MKIEVMQAGENWLASITVKSGNKYYYPCLLYTRPTETQVKTMWRESRKYWKRESI